MKFKQGDVVKLKSGGPAMTIDEEYDSAGGRKLIRCLYFLDNKLAQVKVAENLLEPIE
jgi:uncharacterized protein YodC (DUF2158 family)